MNLNSILLIGFGFFIGWQILAQVVYCAGDYSDHYEEIVEQNKRDKNYCSEVCHVSGSVDRYGDNVDTCAKACKRITKYPRFAALRMTARHYHLCGIDTPCIDVFLKFSTTWAGIATLALGILLLPRLLSYCLGWRPWHLIPQRRVVRQPRRRAVAQPTQVVVEQIEDDNYDDENDPVRMETKRLLQVNGSSGGGMFGTLKSLVPWSNNGKVHSL